MQVISPAGGSYDADGDGLIDLEVVFTDSPSGIDPAAIRLTASGRDLLTTWTISRRDGSGLLAEETVEGLLRAGPVTLELMVADRAGNEREARIGLDLPAATLHRSIALPFDLVRRARDVEMRPDGEVLFVVDETSELLLVDPNEYRLMAQPSGPLDDLQGLAFDPQRNRVYAVSFLHSGLAVFDGGTGDFLELIPTTQGAFTLALSTRTGEAYIPLEIEFDPMNGILSVVDRDAGREVALIQSGITHRAGDGSILGQHAAVLTEDEERLYVPTGSDGVLVYDPHGREFIDQIDLLPGQDERLGAAGAIERVGKDLYVNVLRDIHVGSAVYRIDTDTGEILRIKELGPETDINTGAAASPDGTRLFVSASSGRINKGAANYLLQVPSLEILAPLEGAAAASESFGYYGAAWHPDGKRVYVAAADFSGRNEILVYLARPVR